MFVTPIYPWMVRGGEIYGTTDTGIFSFENWNGAASDLHSFRIVVSVS